jgi:hypothetical protein
MMHAQQTLLIVVVLCLLVVASQALPWGNKDKNGKKKKEKKVRLMLWLHIRRESLCLLPAGS